MSTIPLQAGETYNRRIVVRDASGVPVPADSTPSGILYRNGATTVVVVSISQLSPVEYNLSFTVPGDAVSSDTWQLLLSTTVAGIAVDRWVQLSQAIFLTSTIRRGFVIRGASGLGEPADSTPTAVVLRNNIEQVTAVSVAPVGSPSGGRYLLTFAVDGGWSVGDELQVKLTATINGSPVSKLWYLGQIIDPNDVTITIATLNVLSDEQDIQLADDEQALTLSDDEQTITLACE
jgi:hypothetical protein